MARYDASVGTRISNNPTALQTSGDTSSTEFTSWTVFTQTIDGMWKRVFQYGSTPSVAAAGVVSGAPLIDLSYVDVNCTVTTKQQFIDASYASGLSQNLNLEYTSDSTIGGYGLSGTFSTTKMGLLRKIKTTTDLEHTCTNTFNVVAGKQPGAYDTTYDGSGVWKGDFYTNVLIPASQQCTTFIPTLVDM